jgi:predicted ATPase/class 3 adenylate cyclase
VPDLPPTEANNRFQIVFLKFAKVLATAEHPLVLFLDDLQWSDAPTLSLVQRLVTASDTAHLLVVGAYRSNEVGDGHLLPLLIDEVRKVRAVTSLSLQPLARAAVDQLTADTLHTDVSDVQPLTDLLFEKAGGNPFFITELLKRLHERGAIVFSPEAGSWTWDVEAVRDAEVGANIVDFVVANLRRLPVETQRALRLAACIGGAFDLRTLALIGERSTAETGAALQAALVRSVVAPLNDSYRYVGVGADADELDPWYRFQHDRVQQAAYALIDEQRRRHVHLSIGRLMLADGVGTRLIDIVGHLNSGRALLTTAAERRDLAELNLRAAGRAEASSAYGAAFEFLEVGLGLLPDDPWTTDPRLMWQVATALQRCAYLTARYDDAEAWIGALLAHAPSDLDRAEILATRTRQYATTGRMRESITAAIAGLSLLGFAITAEPTPDDVAAAVVRVRDSLGGREVADLIDAPALSDPTQLVAIRLLMEIFPAAFLSGSGDLFPYLVLECVDISLRHGSSPESAFAYAAYGMLLCGELDDPGLGYAYGKLGVAMIDKLGDVQLRARVIYVYAMFVHHWSNHWSTMTPWFLQGIEAGYQSGDMLYLAYSAQDCVIWDPTLDLETASREQRKYLRIVRDCEYQDSLDSGTLFLQMQLNFQGLTDSLYSMNDAEFDEQATVDGMRARRFMTGIANHHIYKAEIHLLYEDFEGAFVHVLAQDALIASSMSLPQLVRAVLISFLTRAERYPRTPVDEQEVVRERLYADARRMSRWAVHCADNFAHLQYLMEAELDRLFGGMDEAIAGYDRAIERANRARFRRDEAMANEVAARFLLGAGLARAAEGYLRAAHYLYYRWGARRKVEQLERRHPLLLRPLAPVRTDGMMTMASLRGTTSGSIDSAQLDMASVMKASRTISGAIVLEKLWKTTLQVLLENAGGRKAAFLRQKDGCLVIEAQGEAGRDMPALTRSLPVETAGSESVLPVSIVRTVLRTGKALVLADATDSSFAADPYVSRHRVRAVLCAPVSRRGVVVGAIYLENALTSGAFTDERVEVIKLLSAQAATSMENARLYEEQARQIAAQRRFVPRQFLESLGHHDIAEVGLGEHVEREMSVMFSDLRDFTPLTERLGARAVIDLLNRYFSTLEVPIREAGGFIDSFNGDEIMALFGVAPDHAVQAGVAMCRELQAFNLRSATIGQPPLRMGIGVNTGMLVLGTVGGNDRLKCGVVGDTVNLASRIEQLTKTYGVPFLIGEHTFEGLREPGRFTVRCVDRVAVKGKSGAVTLYEVLDAETDARREAKQSTVGLLDEARERYAAREFARALALLREARRLDPADRVLDVLIARCGRYLDEPPGPDWEGFETLDHK